MRNKLGWAQLCNGGFEQVSSWDSGVITVILLLIKGGEIRCESSGPEPRKQTFGVIRKIRVGVGNKPLYLSPD